MSATDNAVWLRLIMMLPRHDCGQRMLPGGTEDTGPLLVCIPCSHVEAVDGVWLDDIVATAREQAEA